MNSEATGTLNLLAKLLVCLCINFWKVNVIMCDCLFNQRESGVCMYVCVSDRRNFSSTVCSLPFLLCKHQHGIRLRIKQRTHLFLLPLMTTNLRLKPLKDLTSIHDFYLC